MSEYSYTELMEDAGVCNDCDKEWCGVTCGRFQQLIELQDKRRTFLVPLNAKELEVLHEMANKQELSPERILSSGLRLYQMLHSGLYKFVEVNPMPMMLQWNSTVTEDQKAEVVAMAERIWNASSFITHSEPVEFHDPFTRLLEKLEQLHTQITGIEEKLKEKKVNADRTNENG